MIANVGNGWPVQRTDATRIAGDLLTRIDSRTSAVNPPAGREQEEGPRREDQTERKAGSERQVGDELAMQLQQSRLSRTDAGRNAQAGNAEKAEPAGSVSLAVAGSQGEPADLNRDGAIGPQESSAHQTRQTEPVQAEAETQQQRQAAERIATRLAQTYGRFDPEIANATLRVNPFHIAA